jgi:hypothetical protein
VTLAIPSDAAKVEVALCLSDDEDDDPIALEYQVQVEALGDSPEHKNQRLLNLGFAAQLPEGAPGDESGDEEAGCWTSTTFTRRRQLHRPIGYGVVVVG